MSSSNPFADEHVPETGERLTSAESPLNPYAAPATVGPLNTLPTGVGIWRDGEYLVIHPDVRFPDRCVISGVESFERYRQDVRWYYPIDFATRTLRVNYGLAPAMKQRVRERRMWSLVFGLAGGAVLLGMWLARFEIPAMLAAWLVPASIVAIALSIFYLVNGGRLLTFYKVKTPYLWLSGAGQPFLNSLPTWPGNPSQS